MFGIGGGELVFIILMVLMLFGSDKIPEIARTAGKIMRQLKHATNDIKSEIQKSAEENGYDPNSLTSGFTDEIKKIKEEVGNSVSISDIKNNKVVSEIEKTKEDIENLTGPIKRQF